MINKITQIRTTSQTDHGIAKAYATVTSACPPSAAHACKSCQKKPAFGRLELEVRAVMV